MSKTAARTALLLLTATTITTRAQTTHTNAQMSTGPDSVNLGAWQTPIKNQGGRRTCITFAAIGALESAYKKAGYGDIILSEEFLNHMGKTFWLDMNWDTIVNRGNDGKENQVAAFGGGQAYTYIEQLGHVMKVPEEEYMAYKNKSYTAADFPPLVNPWNSTYWLLQKRGSDFNLDTSFLPPAALIADKYYSIKSYTEISGRKPDEVEIALANGYSVAWDLSGRIPPIGNAAKVWQPCNTCKKDAHGMLIIGYVHKWGNNDSLNYFIVKNSWGKTRYP